MISVIDNLVELVFFNTIYLIIQKLVYDVKTKNYHRRWWWLKQPWQWVLPFIL